MGLRFRKSYKLPGGFRINLSKSGVGYSWGTKGYRITKTANGKVRKTVSIPGTGISHVTESKAKTRPVVAPKVPDITNFNPDKALRGFVLSSCILFLLACLSFSIGVRAYILDNRGGLLAAGMLIAVSSLFLISRNARNLSRKASAYKYRQASDETQADVQSHGIFAKCEHCKCTYPSKKLSERGYCPQCEQAYQKALAEHIEKKNRARAK